MNGANMRSAKKNESGVAVEINDQQVLDHLRANPDFFRHHPEAIASLTLPHNSGAAVSLVERQVAVLRERSIQSRRKLSELVDVAKDNDQLFGRTQALVLALLQASSLDALHTQTISQFRNSFEVQQTALLFLTSSKNSHGALVASEQCRDRQVANENIGQLIDAPETFCGVLRDVESEFIFGSSAGTASAAVASREVDAELTILLAVANDDSDHYSQNTGTLFIDYIADILALRLQQILK
ncbi:MAG: DUF484 family protein [Pseudomonadales bacterium]|nr:DUF484 family protein [Pseudomonadales bacterium]